jgi:uncharacterized RDD family membrane protein YckC
MTNPIDPSVPPAEPTPPPGGGFPPPPAGGQYPPAPAGGRYQPAPPPPPGQGSFEGHYDPSGLGLPPGVELASVGRRIGAFFLAIPLVIVTLVIGYIVWGLILWGRGTSPALKVLKMKVWKVDRNGKATFGTMALRDIVGSIVTSILSLITELISFIMFLSGKHHKSLCDTIAGTVVVYDPNDVLG